MVFLPHIEKPFQWANVGTFKTNIFGVLMAFWCSYVVIGASMITANKVGEAFIGLLFFFYLCSPVAAIVSGAFARVKSNPRSLLLIGLSMMAVGTLPVLVVNSFGLFALLVMMMGFGYAIVISVTGGFMYQLLDDDEESLSRGRSNWGTLNHLASMLGFLVSLWLMPEHQMMWFVIAVVSLLVSFCVVMWINEEVEWSVPDGEQLPFYEQLRNRDKSVRFSLPYVLVVAGSVAVRLWPVYYMDKWVALAMIVAVELSIVLSGPLQVKGLRWLKQKDEYIREQLTQLISLVTSGAFVIALLFISTGLEWLCIFGSALVGLALRVFTYLGLPGARQKKRGAFTFVIVTGVGQLFGIMVAMVSLNRFAFVLLPFAMLLVAYYGHRVKLSK